MVAAANPHAARAGQQILRAGGSAVDAAVAMALVLTLVEPQSSGIGGGAFMLHYQADNRSVQAYDGRETAPALADGRMFLDPRGKPRRFMDAVVGGLSVGVPGELRMLELAHRQHGKLPWKQLFAPAITLARKGFAVSPRLHKLLTSASRLRSMPAAARYFYDPRGNAKPVGSNLKNRTLAKLLQRLADGGADAFYRGDIARDIADKASGATRNPGRLRPTDLATYRAVKRRALCRPYRSFEICGMPPPTSGGITTLQILGMLERFDLKPANVFSSDTVPLVTEASRLAFADRGRYIADSD
ncbi:MAG TPA: gamma-glutamyltransferase, partial [Sorangium sp.]|nr:gamma-glutamyltransferase [Sorangium sp.]